MAVPTISAIPGGALHFRVGQPVTIGLSASDTPTSWSVSAGQLPTGLSLNNSGEISGTPTVAAYRTISVTATNGTGDSTPVTFPIGVAECGEGSTAEITDPAILLNHSLDDTAVSNPAGYTPPRGADLTKPSDVESRLGPPIMALSKGDEKLISLGVSNGGAQIAADVKLITFALKEFEGETLYTLSDGVHAVTGAGGSSRYQFPIALGASAFGRLLASYAEDEGTYFDAIGEIELQLNRLVAEAKQAVTAVDSATNETLTIVAHGYANGDQVTMHGSDLPAGLSEGVTYWVVEKVTDTFKLAATQGGAAINLTDDGSGTIQAQRHVPGSYTHTSQPFTVRVWRDLII